MRSIPDNELDLVVTARRSAAEGVVVLDLRRADGAELPGWEPGAHIDLVLTPEITRQYSLCGDPADRATWRIAVLREAPGRGGSTFVHEHLRVGADVVARGPRNHFDLVESRKYLFIAGGIGITPIMPMVTHAEEVGASWSLAYGGRSRATMAFVDELIALGSDRVSVCPQDEMGVLDLSAILEEPDPETAVYVCGPEPLLDAVTAACASWPEQTLHIERFSAKSLREPIGSSSFEVELALSGITLTVPPEQSILDAVVSSGVEVMSSCNEGTCGTCETPVMEGAVDHRDSLLTEDEQLANETMMICVSRARCPRLVLEL